MACLECDAIAAGRIALARRGGLVIHGKLEPPPVPGWIVVAPAMHIERIEDVPLADLAALGPLIAEISRALRDATPCEKVYLSLFAEKLPHVHVHLIARPPNAPSSLVGPAIFSATGMSEEDRVVRAVLAKL